MRTRRSLKSTFAASDSARSARLCASMLAARDLEGKSLKDFVVKRVPFRLPAVALRFPLSRALRSTVTGPQALGRLASD